MPSTRCNRPVRELGRRNASDDFGFECLYDLHSLDALSLDGVALKKAEGDAEFAAALKKKYLVNSLELPFY